MHWSEGQQTKLQKLVEDSMPLIGVRAAKGEQRPVLHIVAPRHAETVAA